MIEGSQASSIAATSAREAKSKMPPAYHPNKHHNKVASVDVDDDDESDAMVDDYNDEGDSDEQRRPPRMRPLEVSSSSASSSYKDFPSNGGDDGVVHVVDEELAFNEDNLRGATGVMKTRRKKSRLSKSNKILFIVGVILFVVLTIGAGVTVGKSGRNDDDDDDDDDDDKDDNDDNSSPSAADATTPAPIPAVPSPPPPPQPQPTPAPILQVVQSPITTPPTPAPFFQLSSGGFVDFSNVITPPNPQTPPSSLPSHIDPAFAFGHVVAMSVEGGQFVAAMKSTPSDPPASFGAFHVFQLDVIAGTFAWSQTLYDELTTTPTPHEKSAHHQALSTQGEKIAFTQGDQIAVYFEDGNGHYVPLSNNIQNLGPTDVVTTDDHWFPVQIALSPSAMMLAVLLCSSSDGGNVNQTGRVEIYHDVQSHDPNKMPVDTWTRMGEFVLDTPVTGGTLAFSMDETFLAVGYYFDNDGSTTTETLLTLSHTTNGGGGGTTPAWIIGGNNPMTVARTYFGPAVGGLQNRGGSVVSLSYNGKYMAIGSYKGVLNKVVVLRWDSGDGDSGNGAAGWQAFGMNNVLYGIDQTSSFGAHVQLSAAGNRLFVGAPGDGSNDAPVGEVFVHQYDPDQDRWVALGAPLRTETPLDGFGSTLSVDKDAVELVVGIPNHVAGGATAATSTGAVQVFRLEES